MEAIIKLQRSDIDVIKSVIEPNRLFSADLLDEMTADYFNNLDTKEIWLTAEIDNKAIAVAYCVPERMTEGTYNLYLIAIHADY